MRIRTIKPEWLGDDRLIEAGSDARVVSIALLLLADDYGCGRLGMETRVRVFPKDRLDRFDNAFEQLEPWYARAYEVRGQRYFEVVNWSKHQLVKNPSKPHVPGPQEADSTETLRRLYGDSTETLTKDQDQDQDQGPGPKEQGSTSSPPKPARKVRAPRLAPGLVEELFSYWQKAFGHERSKLDDKRARLLRAALRQYGMVDCKLVCDGVKRSPYHMGQNENQIVYDKISLLYRDGEHIEKYRGWATSPPKGAGYRDEIDELIARTKKGR